MIKASFKIKGYVIERITLIFLHVYLFIYFVSMFMCGCVSHGAHVEVKGLFAVCGLQGSCSGSQG